MLIALATAGAVRHGQAQGWNVFASFLFIPARNSERLIEPFVGVGWTLNYEMFFYALFCVGLLLFRRGTLFAALACLMIGVASFGYRPAAVVAGYYFNDIIMHFALGIGWAFLLRRGVRLPPTLAVIAAVVALGLLIGNPIPWLPQTINAGLPAALLVAAVTSLEPSLHGRVPRAVMFGGAASYALYLFHPLVAPAVPEALRRMGVHSGALSIAGSIALAVVAGAAVHVFVELPLTRLIKRRIRRPAGRLPTVPSEVSGRVLP